MSTRENPELCFKDEEEVVEAADRIDRRAYWKEVRDIAAQAFGEHPEEEEEQETFARRFVDGHDWLLHDPLYILQYTAHEDDGFDANDRFLRNCADAGAAYGKIAMEAMYGDVLEALLDLRGGEEEQDEEDDDEEGDEGGDEDE